ncbi:hypothetical protein, partial [uncultured Selenomonas sp.]|uniref:hypothetical protein n=1 Tax=uncultured Selenomonas sp. TaxID=159275 RepID=UPI0028DC4B56
MRQRESIRPKNKKRKIFSLENPSSLWYTVMANRDKDLAAWIKMRKKLQECHFLPCLYPAAEIIIIKKH